MNALSHMGHAAQLMREQDPGESGHWILYIHQHKLKLKAAQHKEPEDYTLMGVTRIDLDRGLSPKRWNLLESALRIAIEKGVLE